MFADTSAIRGLAADLRERASDLRRTANNLVLNAEQVWWSGIAATAMRTATAEGAAVLHRSAGAHDFAAEALTRHAAAVDHRIEVLRAVAAKAAEAASDAAHAAQNAAEQAADAVGDVLADGADLVGSLLP